MYKKPKRKTAPLSKNGFALKKRIKSIRSYSKQLRFEHCEERRMLATVNVLHDIFDIEDNDTTLREAIVDANQNPGADTINFALPAGLNTITLTDGDLGISDDLTINGPGQDASGNFRLTISGINNNDRIFDVLSSSLEVNGL